MRKSLETKSLDLLVDAVDEENVDTEVDVENEVDVEGTLLTIRLGRMLRLTYIVGAMASKRQWL